MEVLLFGIAREIVGEAFLKIPGHTNLQNVADLRAWIEARYPQFRGLSSLAVAVNHEYAQDQDPLPPGAEIALIPPVSGG